ncbi:type II toxin-antitoxin system RatA family toxin [Thermopetrobacter sp. TC1]|uniref:type II toxin-antitoxin system RatA family toxin n=1 Tax=Thermopetrobacter sp. TC1 TaxID=1495045 RepID=UPI00056F67C1|nr:type II toxin-antitoxin system RatA family toxin [Thermopetrobacter sp. TC1]
MATHRFVKWLPHPPEHLFAIVSDVSEYGRFVPLCERAEVWDVRQDGPVKKFRARLEIAYPKLGLREYFVSDVEADAEKLLVIARSREGAVKDLENRWLFKPRRGGTDIHFSLRFTMSSRLLQKVMDAAFDYASRKILKAFEERADELARLQRLSDHE